MPVDYDFYVRQYGYGNYPEFYGDHYEIEVDHYAIKLDGYINTDENGYVDWYKEVWYW